MGTPMMTKEEAIDFLKSEREATIELANTCNTDQIDYFKKHVEAYDIAIEAINNEIIREHLWKRRINMNTETQNFEQERKILDTGHRHKFESGAVRDCAEGRGRCDLLPLDVIGDYFGYRVPSDCGYPQYIDEILHNITDFIYTGNITLIYDTITMFMDNRGWSTITAILEVSKHYEEGAKKYDERNWEKGIPTHCYVDSGIRHLLKYYGKWDDEPHDRAFLWNMLGLLWTLKHHPELNDLPYAKTQLSEEEKDYIKKDIQLTKEAYHRIINDNYDNPLQAADDINELVDALEKGDEIHKIYKGFSVDFNPGICISCSSFAGAYKKCDKGVMVNSKIVDCNKYGMESEVAENGNT